MIKEITILGLAGLFLFFGLKPFVEFMKDIVFFMVKVIAIVIVIAIVLLAITS